MCTVVIDVAADGVRLLAVRDEDPQRPWDDLGTWWPHTHPGVIGIRDRRAGGAWLAINHAERRLAVLLNRADVVALSSDQAVSRGALVLQSVTGNSPTGPLPMHGFNLLEVDPSGARVLSWDGVELRSTPVPDGVHMIAHDDLDDPRTARISAWLPPFAAQRPHDDRWAERWIGVLAESTRLPIDDDRAIIRDNNAHGYPTMSLLYCTAEVTDAGVEIESQTLATPGHWS